jgi:hypothetical protein
METTAAAAAAATNDNNSSNHDMGKPDWSSSDKTQGGFCTPDVIICTLMAAFIAVLYRDTCGNGNRAAVCV